MTQINHEYKCPYHGKFDYSVLFGKSPPPETWCPVSIPGGQCDDICLQSSPWVPPTVSVVWGGGFTKT